MINNTSTNEAHYDLVLTAAAGLVKALQNPCPNYPLHPLADNEPHKLHDLQTILHN
jgi:hypothetical protein